MSRHSHGRGAQDHSLPTPPAQVDPPQTANEVPTLRPTLEEFQDFEQFVKEARAAFPHYGMVKVIAPEGWRPRKSGRYEDVDRMLIPLPIKQVLQGTRGVYQQYNIEQKPITVAEFREMATKVAEDSKVTKLNPSERDRAFWRTVAFNPVLYGADMPGSLFDASVGAWNLAKLPSLLDLLPTKLSGINEPYIYFGMWKADFAWHVEDMDLYSINYLHFGEPKAWYSVPHQQMNQFEQSMANLFPDAARQCKQFLRHKQSLVSPYILQGTYGLTVHTAIQEAGQFIITWPGAYHAGFNHGFNCAEAVNFALDDWIPLGQVSKPCLCDAQRALINMDYFVYQYEVKKYGRPITKPDLDISRFNTSSIQLFSPITGIPHHAHTDHATAVQQRSVKAPVSRKSSVDKAAPAPAPEAAPSKPAPKETTNTSPSPKKKSHNRVIHMTKYEIVPRPQLVRPPVPGARISPRFHPSVAPSADAPPSHVVDTSSSGSKKRKSPSLGESLVHKKIAKVSERIHETHLPAEALAM